jgi:methylthioribose-1-phosphate isomerase
MPQRAIRVVDHPPAVEVIDQTLLPHELRWVPLLRLAAVVEAIRAMRVRGAPLIGVTAAYGLWLATRDDPSDEAVLAAAAALRAARPTAVNLGRAVERVAGAVVAAPVAERAQRARAEADAICAEEAAAGRAIGDYGLTLLREAASRRPGSPVQILTHCNTGWLATVEYGTALAPIYRARQEGLPVHVWVPETRPRNQGWLTAWELDQEEVPFTVVPDNMAGHLIQRGEVDLVLVGSDRTTRTGDVCNKIGTYLRAVVAREHGVPFYVAVPSSSIDWTIRDGTTIPLEERSPNEVIRIGNVALGPVQTPVRNVAFDVTPARLVTALVTERGICPASEAGLRQLFPDLAT